MSRIRNSWPILLGVFALLSSLATTYNLQPAEARELVSLGAWPQVHLAVTSGNPGPGVINPVTVRYTTHGCYAKEMFLILNAPAMGIPWSYFTGTAWLPLPADLADITPYSTHGPEDGDSQELFFGTVPPGSYDLYLGCDFVQDGHLTMDSGADLNINGVYDHFSVAVQNPSNLQDTYGPIVITNKYIYWDCTVWATFTNTDSKAHEGAIVYRAFDSNNHIVAHAMFASYFYANTTEEIGATWEFTDPPDECERIARYELSPGDSEIWY